MTALGGFGVASTAVKAAASSTKNSVVKLVSKPKKKSSKAKLAAKKRSAKKSNRYLAQVTLDVYVGNNDNWPGARNTHGSPVGVTYVCHRTTSTSPWESKPVSHTNWKSSDSSKSHVGTGHALDKGYFATPQTAASCAAAP